MKALGFPFWLCLVCLASPVRADEALPADILQRVKAATVFIKVQSGPVSGTGSGFVLHAEDTTAYIVTNEHVVVMQAEEDPPRLLPEPPRLVIPRMEIPQPPRLGIPRMEIPRPFPSMLPRPPRFTLPELDFPRFMPPARREPARALGQVRVVLGSGTRTQQEVPAQVLFHDAQGDLALLVVRGVKGLPAALPVPPALKLAETMPVYVFGYPLGKDLDPSGPTPATVVGKGVINGLREDRDGKLDRVLVEAEVHPGNSGGPVVDARGRLVGITAAKVRNTRIGVVIPATHLGRLLRARFIEVGFYPKRLEPIASRVCVNLLLFDPLKQTRSARISWLPPEVATTNPPPGAGGLAGVPGSQTSDLKPGQTTWIGHLRCPTPTDGPATLPFQIVFVPHEGAAPEVVPVMTYRWLPSPLEPQRSRLSEEDLARVRAALESDHFQVRREAAERLAAAEPIEPRAEMIRVLRNLLGHEDGAVRESSARALGAWAGADALPDLLRRMKAEDFPWIRWTLIEEVGKVGGQKAAQVVAECLSRETYSEFPGRALRVMGSVAEPSVLPLLKHKDAAIRREACWILEAIGTKQSLPALETVVAKEGGDNVAEAARAAIEAIKGRQ